MRRAALVTSGFIMAGALIIAMLGNEIATYFNPVPNSVSFDNEWQRLRDLDAALLQKHFDQIAHRPASTPTPKGQLVLPEAPLPEVRVSGMSFDDLNDAKVALTKREEHAEQTHFAALSTRRQSEDLITNGAIIVFWLTLTIMGTILMAPAIQRRRARWANRRRIRLNVSGVNIAEKAGVLWGSAESASAPLRDAFGRGRRQARGEDGSD